MATPKTVFALYGSANVGKSATIRKIFDLLTLAYPNAPVQHLHNPGVDISAILEIKGVFIGIESQGDPGSRLAQSLEKFRNAKCRIIVCATRNWGGTVDAVKQLESEYSVVWHKKKAEPIVKLQDRRNKVAARIVFNQIKKLL